MNVKKIIAANTERFEEILKEFDIEVEYRTRRDPANQELCLFDINDDEYYKSMGSIKFKGRTQNAWNKAFAELICENICENNFYIIENFDLDLDSLIERVNNETKLLSKIMDNEEDNTVLASIAGLENGPKLKKKRLGQK